MNRKFVTSVFLGTILVTVAAADSIDFTDVTEQAGLSYIQHSGA